VPIGEELPDHLNLARDAFGDTFWLRAYHGAGARGAILVSDLREAYHWIRLHEVRFGMHGSFVAEEYLPGFDLCWTGLYHEGDLVTSFHRERLEWIYPRLAPFSGRTGTPTRSVIRHWPTVNRVGEQSVAAVDSKPHGVYCVDMRCDDEGVPRPTEINAGRYATTSSLWSHSGPNLVAAQIRLATGDDPGDLPRRNLYHDGRELLRHVDMDSVVFPGRA
jgi:carbamoyl-phosphate synthase large subunit